MYCSNKRQLVEKSTKAVSIITWLREVQGSGYILGKIETNTATTTRARSQSVLEAKLAALEIRTYPKGADIDEILADIPKGK